MGLFARSVKHGSRRLWPAVLGAAALGTSGAGCVIVDDGGDTGYTQPDYTAPPPPPSSKPMQVSVDPGAAINAKPGEGVGFYVEYRAGGTWHIWTTCDTNVTGYACGFDAIVSPQTGDAIRAPQSENLESDDVITIDSDGSVEFSATTDADTDGMTFTTSPGAAIRIDMMLDSYRQPQFIYWFGGGVLHTGAPSDPVDFLPTSS